MATKYPNIARRHFAARGVQAEVVHLNGAMELAPGLGLSRLIVDLVQTGSTLRANGLRETEVIAQVTSRLIVNRTALKTQPEAVGALIARFRAALGRMKRLATTDAGFAAAFDALLHDARDTTARVDAPGRRHHRRRARPRRRGAARLHRPLRPPDATPATLRVTRPRSTPPPPPSPRRWPRRWTWPPPGSRRSTAPRCRPTSA